MSWYTSYITINWHIHYLSDQRHKLEPTYINGSITAFIEANIEEQILFFFTFRSIYLVYHGTLFVQPAYKGTLSFIGSHFIFI